jgi:hypothetical protein
MQRRKFLIGAGSIAAGGAAVMGTGAFSQATVSARDFEGTVSNDNEALLRLNPTVSPYAEQSSDGELDVLIDGLNQNSTFTFPQVFRIHNDGTQSVDISINLGSNPGGIITSVLGSGVGSNSSTNLASNSINIGSGGSLDVGVKLDVGSGTGTDNGTFDVIASES